MNYGDLIRERRNALGLNQAALAEILGVSRNAVAGWETGHSRPDLDTLPRLCSALRISLDRFFQRDGGQADAERKVLDLFFSLEERDREIITWQMEAIRDHRAAPPAVRAPRVRAEKAAPPRVVSLYRSDLGAAAGYGAPLGAEQGEEMILLADAETEQADEIITVCGDSMEPTFRDGDLVLVKRKSEVRFGEIGIFLVDNEGYIKEYQEDGLHSHNPKYRVMRFHDDQTVRCIGRVIGKVKASQIPTEEQLKLLGK